MTFSITALCHYTEYHAEFRVLYINMLSFVMLSDGNKFCEYQPRV
jgi:hypothetical protein